MKKVRSDFKYRIFCQFVGNAENHRANFAVFVGQTQYLVHAFAVGVRIIATGFGSVFVYHTVIVRHQKRAGR